VLTFAFNFVGDGVRDAVDPRQRSAARGATDT
jgi:ABC-type dipeptide/oligopeptide/nickel transport system permease subunit